eukprot:217731_1
MCASIDRRTVVLNEEETTSVGADGVQIQNEKLPQVRGTTGKGDGEDVITLVGGYSHKEAAGVLMQCQSVVTLVGLSISLVSLECCAVANLPMKQQQTGRVVWGD